MHLDALKNLTSVQVSIYPSHLSKALAVPVGVLKREPISQNYIFQYSQKYLEKGKSFGPVDPVNFPLSEKAYVLGKKISGVFADSAPDWWGRQILSQIMENPNLSELQYLAAPDSGRMGNLDFGFGTTNVPGLSDLPEYLKLAQHIENKNLLSSHEKDLLQNLYHGASIGGGRPKLNIMVDDEIWIAKLPSIHDPWVNGRIELFAMKLAQTCGINIPELKIVDEDILLVKRFDRVGTQKRVGYLSARSLLQLKSGEEGSYIDLAYVMRKHNMLGSCRQLFRRMCFNAIIRNTDDHPQNHGFLFDGRILALSPAFDIVPIPWALQMDKPAYLGMNAGQKGKSTDQENLFSECDAFGINREEAVLIFLDIINRLKENWRLLIEECDISTHDEKLLSPIIQHWEQKNEI